MERREGGMDPKLAEAFKAERESIKDTAYEFFPDYITKEVLAPNFNLAPKEISNKELVEMQEFSVNAGVEMAREAQRSKSEVIFIGHHDIFHAADMMRRTNGKSPLSEFVSTPRPERYINTDIMRDELYPLLFLAIDGESPLSVEIMSEDGRQRVKEYLKNTFGLEGLTSLDAQIDEGDADALQELYEEVVKQVLIVNGERVLKDIGQDELIEKLVEDTEACFKEGNWSEYYTAFAKRVFGQEYKENPRLFLDQFLQDIRSLPNRS